MKVRERQVCVKGAPICRGIAIGKPFFFTFIDDAVPEFAIPLKDIDEEIARYRNAMKRSREDVKRLQKKLKKEKILEGAAILDTHIQMMLDPLLTDHIEEEIKKSRKNAEFIFHNIVNQYQKKFQSLADPFFRERFKDIQDISRRVMGYLHESVRVSLADIPSDSVVFSDDLTAFDTAEANVASVKAFVTQKGSATSHAAIVAKAKGIPYITDIPFEKLLELDHDDNVIVDGRTGDIIFFPTKDTLQYYRQLKESLDHHLVHLVEQKPLPAETRDGCAVKLSSNIDMSDELDTFHQYGGEGVGLFRSEYIFLSNDSFPTEEEQFTIYLQLVKKMQGLPIVIRTFDFGGDKLMLNPYLPPDANSFLGCRAIRFLLKERDIFKAQLRAILRASIHGVVSIMFPMISTLAELLEAKELLREAYDELKTRGIDDLPLVRVGSMIEVPSAAIISDLIAKECDFVSIGTNDLIQYSLAVDRRNHSSHQVYASADPSVLRMIKLVVGEANHQGIPVTVCGEVAADPRFTALLLGLGLHEFSVAPRYLPVIRQAVRNTCIVDACALAEKALRLKNAQEIQELIGKEYLRTAPGDQLYNC
jgi:phosphoenolpyruvate-protein phosphotransferase (PTS system enzyme I)